MELYIHTISAGLHLRKALNHPLLITLQEIMVALCLVLANLSEISFEDNSTVLFNGNTADNGGVFYFTNSNIIFKESSVVLFFNNKARQSGGVGYFNFNSQVMFKGTIAITFYNNTV